MLTLMVEKRASGAGGLGAMRRAGQVPAVVYGAHKEATPIMVPAIAFGKVLRAAGEATIVSLEGLGASLPTLIHQVDLDPLTSLPRHIDFYAVTKGEKVEVAIPLAFVGSSPAVEGGANMVKVMHELEVEADPMNLPSTIEVDISKLVAVDDRITAGDLKLPAGVALAVDASEVVVLAQAVVEEKVEAVSADISTIEVEKKGKEEAPVEEAK